MLPAAMERVSRAELEGHLDDFDAAVERDSAIDPFCARSAWQLSYHDAFAADRPLYLAREGADWALFAEHGAGQDPRYLEPLENMWGFASPLVGRGAVALLAEQLLERPSPVLLLGLPADRKRLAPLARVLSGKWAGRTLAPTTRFVASLEGGIDGWLCRRSASFRRNLRADLRRMESAGVSFRQLESPSMHEFDALYARVLEIEGRSWKSAKGNGADCEPMRTFYAEMWRRLIARGQLRLILAELDGRTVGYLYGALVDGHFRGLQFSFEEAVRALGVGNGLQYQMLCWLCELGAAQYDLGAQSAYKRRWAEDGPTTIGLFLQPMQP